jgi:hypothetical protein
MIICDHGQLVRGRLVTAQDEKVTHGLSEILGVLPKYGIVELNPFTIHPETESRLLTGFRLRRFDGCILIAAGAWISRSSFMGCASGFFSAASQGELFTCAEAGVREPS